jgi:hypothetical protein
MQGPMPSKPALIVKVTLQHVNMTNVQRQDLVLPPTSQHQVPSLEGKSKERDNQHLQHKNQVANNRKPFPDLLTNV